MMGGGLCWLDYDADGWLDLYVVNSYSDVDFVRWEEQGGLPRSGLFRNVRGRFENVGAGSGADLQLRGSGCVAADFNGDGHTDLYVTTTGYNVATDGYDALLWGHGDGTFTEGARAAGHRRARLALRRGRRATSTATAVPTCSSPGYTDVNAPIPGSAAGLPLEPPGRARPAVPQPRPGRERPLALPRGRPRGGPRAGAARPRARRGLHGRRRGRSPRSLRRERRGPEPALPERAAANGARLPARGGRRRRGRADPNAGMGIAAADYNRDGRADLFVTNSRDQLHAVFRSATRAEDGSFVDARRDFAAALGTSYTGWGVSWADLDLDGDLDLVLANGAIPLAAPRPRRAAGAGAREHGRRGTGAAFADAGAATGLDRSRRVNGRGLAAADYDNDGDLDVAVNAVGGRLMLLRDERRDRALARGAAAAVRSGNARHRRPAGRAHARPRGARGQQLPLVRGPATSTSASATQRA